jgi:hypothetical protein
LHRSRAFDAGLSCVLGTLDAGLSCVLSTLDTGLSCVHRLATPTGRRPTVRKSVRSV